MEVIPDADVEIEPHVSSFGYRRCKLIDAVVELLLPDAMRIRIERGIVLRHVKAVA
jgi:hypothetical protein